MTTHELYPTLDRMRRYGGNFCRCLADAIAAADPGNRAWLLQGSAQLLQRYGPDSPCAQAQASDDPSPLIVLHSVADGQP